MKFLENYTNNINQYENDPNSEYVSYKCAYSALVSICGSPITQEQYETNKYYEQNLINQLINTNFKPVKQDDFYHVRNVNYIQPSDENLVRLYINCNNIIINGGNYKSISEILNDDLLDLIFKILPQAIVDLSVLA